MTRWNTNDTTTNFCVHNGSSTIRITLNKKIVYEQTMVLGRWGKETQTAYNYWPPTKAQNLTFTALVPEQKQLKD